MERNRWEKTGENNIKNSKKDKYIQANAKSKGGIAHEGRGWVGGVPDPGGPSISGPI